MTDTNGNLPQTDNPVIAPDATTKKPSKVWTFILEHKLVFSLLFLLLVVSLWAFIKIRVMESKFEKQTAALHKQYEAKIDSLTAQHYTLTSKVFSWAVRSELTRDNKEQVNQFMLSLIKESSVQKVKYIDAKSARIVLSTDKKDEGQMFSNTAGLLTEQTIHTHKDHVLQVISPVMGLSNKLGVLVIDFEEK